MKYQHSYAVGEYFASDHRKHSSIGRQFRRFCDELAISSAFLLTAAFFSGQAIAADHRIEMTAEQNADGLLAYRMVEHKVDGANITSRYSPQPTIPGPTIVLAEGDTVRLTIRNGITMSPDQQVSVHVHGVHYKILSDGSLKIINKIDDEGAYPDHGGRFYTYFWDVAPGTAGTWPYHDHNFETHNGSEDRGLYGAVIVNPASGTVTASNGGSIASVPVNSIKKDYVLYVSDDAFWGMEIDGVSKKQSSLGPNPFLTANGGDNVRFHLIAMGTYLNRFQLAGYQWVDPGTSTLISEKNIGPLEKHVFTIKALGSAEYINANFSRKLMGMKGSFSVTAAPQ
jgi:FtsP/CotA-like multicopper oxidase with cupredoxin domain